MYGGLLVKKKDEPNSTFTFTHGPSYITSILFTHMKMTRQWKFTLTLYVVFFFWMYQNGQLIQTDKNFTEQCAWKCKEKLTKTVWPGLNNSELMQEDGRGTKMANLVWQMWQFCLEKLSTKLHLPLNRSFCKRLENININIKWRTQQNFQVIALSRLSHTNVLWSSPCCIKSLT